MSLRLAAGTSKGVVLALPLCGASAICALVLELGPGTADAPRPKSGFNAR